MRARLTGVLLAAVLLAGCNATPKTETAGTDGTPPAPSSPSTSPNGTGVATPPPAPSPSRTVPAKIPTHRPKPSTPRPHRPSAKPRTPDVPSGASAVCRDGTLSYSRHRRGTCSHHGGVARWL